MDSLGSAGFVPVMSNGLGGDASLESPEEESGEGEEEVESRGKRRGPRKRTLTLGPCGCAGFSLAGSGLRAFDYFCCSCALFPASRRKGLRAMIIS